MKHQDPEALREAVERLHGVKATLSHAAWVVERFEGQVAWEGTVHVFTIQDHPTATVCYAWTSPVQGSKRRRFYAVLGVPPIKTPGDAVRASIVRDSKKPGG